MQLGELQFALNLSVAVALGAVIGLERQWRQRMAGLRTNTLVAAGSALFVMLAQSIPNGGDVTRIPSYVVSGIGFLGAGVIMKEGASIRGLNTAATLWCSAAIGAIAGFGLVPKALMGTLAILATHLFFRPLAQKLNVVSQRESAETEASLDYRIQIACSEAEEIHIRYLIMQSVGVSAAVLRSIHSEELNGSGKVKVVAELQSASRLDSLLEQIVGRLSLERGVTAVSWRNFSPVEEAA